MRHQIFIPILLTLVIAITSVTSAQPATQNFQQETSAISDEASTLSDSSARATQKLVVQWQNERLTVTAHNTTLRSLLAKIAKQTGLTVEASADTDLGPVYVDLGPGTMRDVLSALLEGDPNNYILVGSARRPGFVERLILSKVDRARVVAANDAPAPPPQPQLYGAGFSVATDSGSNEPPAAADGHESVVNTALPPVQSTVDSTIRSYQEAYAEMLKSGKSRAEILIELQQQQIRDLDAQVAAQSPQQQ